MAQLLYNSCFDTNKMPADLDSFFDYFVEKQSSESAILILPTNKYVQKAKFDFVQKNFEKNKKPTQKLHFYRLQDFAYHCLNKAFPNNNRRVISNAATLYLMEKAANYVEIKYYRSGRKNISLPILKQLMTIILGLKEDGITPFTMKNDLECEQNIASGDLRFNDIQLLYAKYEELLGDNYLDVPSVYYKITDEIDKIIAQNQDNLFTSIIPSPMDNFPIDNLFSNKNTVILFYGFTEFKLPEAQFVSRFAWSKIPTVVNIDYSHISGPEIQSLSRNVRRLAVSGHNQISTDLLKNIHNSDNLSISEYITKWIFNEEHTLHNPKILTQVKIFEAVDRIDEVKNLANLVRYLHKTKNVELSDICICSRKPELYSDLFREIFSESGLIINISDRFSLANSPSIVFIFSLLNIVINHWKYKDIERISENIIIKNKIPNIAILSTVAKKYRISGGIGKNSIEYWKKSFEKYLEFTEEILKKIDNICVDDIEIRNILKDKAELEQANLAFTELAKLINFTNSKISYHDFFEIIQEILAKFEIVENIYKQYFNIYNYNKIHSLSDFQLLEEIEKNAKSLNKFIDILEEFAKIEEECEPNAKYKLSEIVDKFKNAISGEKYQISEKNNLGVNITSIEQSRGIAYKIMILCGAVDSEFPMPFKTDTLLGRELPESEAIHNDNERILFYQFLTNNKKQLDAGEHEIYIFYPKEDAGKQLVRSPFIDDLLNISTNSHSNVFSINEIRQNHIPYLNQKELEWIFYLSQSTDILTDKIINMNKNSFFGTQD